MSDATELIDLTLRAASDLLHRRALSPVELTEAYLARGERWNPHVNAYLTLTADDARATARRAEAELMARKDRGPLQDRKSTRLNSSHLGISYAVFCLKKKKKRKKH